jgi:hypothetical protein
MGVLCNSLQLKPMQTVKAGQLYWQILPNPRMKIAMLGVPSSAKIANSVTDVRDGLVQRVAIVRASGLP